MVFSKKLKKDENKRLLQNPLFFYDSTCKFCKEYSHHDDKLYNICNCKGSLEWCHIYCIREWVKYKYKNKYFCDICRQPYIIPVSNTNFINVTSPVNNLNIIYTI